ncbi:MAG: hypothetical protein KC425_27800 [Anaerolineales bacterium]|nr:hypothetical protein [Anaerolineales bacterium]
MTTPPVTFHYLTPDQSTRLLAWARQAPALADPARTPDERETAVQLILMQFDDLIGHLAEPEDDVVDERRIRLFKNLAWLTGRPAAPGHRLHVARFRQARAAGDHAAAFTHLLQAIKIGHG